MANDNYARGLFPINFNPKADAHYYRASTAGADIFLGQPVDLVSAAYKNESLFFPHS